MYTTKYTVCKHKIRVQDYSQKISKGYHSKRTDYAKTHKYERSDISLNRTRTNIRDLIDCNVTQYSKFITLTFRDDIKSREVALQKFKKFVARYKKIYNEPLKYIAIMELQLGSARHNKKRIDARNVWHFHLISFNDRKIDLKQFEKEVWQYGITNTKKIDYSENISVYLMKYITKDIVNCIGTEKKLILRSRNLKTPEVYYGLEDRQPMKLVKMLEKKDPVFIKTYEYKVPQHLNKISGELIPLQNIDVSMKEYKIPNSIIN